MRIVKILFLILIDLRILWRLSNHSCPPAGYYTTDTDKTTLVDYFKTAILQVVFAPVLSHFAHGCRTTVSGRSPSEHHGYYLKLRWMRMSELPTSVLTCPKTDKDFAH